MFYLTSAPVLCIFANLTKQSITSTKMKATGLNTLCSHPLLFNSSFCKTENSIGSLHPIAIGLIVRSPQSSVRSLQSAVFSPQSSVRSLPQRSPSDSHIVLPIDDCQQNTIKKKSILTTINNY